MGKKSKKGKPRGGQNKHQGTGRGGVKRTKSNGETSSLAAQSIETSENEEVFTSDENEFDDDVTNKESSEADDGGEEILHGATTIDTTESEDVVKNGGNEEEESPAVSTATPNGNDDVKDEETKEEDITTTTTTAKMETEVTPATEAVKETTEVIDHPEDEDDIQEVLDEEEAVIESDPVIATSTANNDDATEIIAEEELPKQVDEDTPDDFVIVDAAEAEGAPPTVDGVPAETIESTTADETVEEQHGEPPGAHVGEVDEQPTTTTTEPDEEEKVVDSKPMVEEEPIVAESTQAEEDAVVNETTEAPQDIENTTTTPEGEEPVEATGAEVLDPLVVVDEIVDSEPTEVEEPFVEETVVEETMVEEAAAKEPVVEEIVPEEPIVEEIVAEEPVVEETVAEEPVVEETVAEEPVVEETVAEEPVVEETVAEEPVVEETVAEEPVVEETVAEEPVVEEIAVESVATATTEIATIESTTEPLKTSEEEPIDDVVTTENSTIPAEAEVPDEVIAETADVVETTNNEDNNDFVADETNDAVVYSNKDLPTSDANIETNTLPEPTVTEVIAKVEELTETIVEAQATSQPSVADTPVEINSDSLLEDVPPDEGSPEIVTESLDQPSTEEADVHPIPHVGTVVTSKTDDIVEEAPAVVEEANTTVEEVQDTPVTTATEIDEDKIDTVTESEPTAVAVEESYPDDEVPTDTVTSDDPVITEPAMAETAVDASNIESKAIAIDSEPTAAPEGPESTEDLNTETGAVEETLTSEAINSTEVSAVENTTNEIVDIIDTKIPVVEQVEEAPSESKTTEIEVPTEEKTEPLPADIPAEEVVEVNDTAVEESTEVAPTESTSGIVIETTNLTSPIPHVGTVDESKTFDFVVDKDTPSNPAAPDEKEAIFSATTTPDANVLFDEVKAAAAEPPAPVISEPDSHIETQSLPVEAESEKVSTLPETSDLVPEKAIEEPNDEESKLDDDNKENSISLEKTMQPIGFSKPDLVDQTNVGKSEAKGDPKGLVVDSADDVAIEISLVDEAAKHNARLSSVLSEESNADEANNKAIAAAATASPSNASVGMTSLLSEPARQEKEISQKDCDCACTIM